jgi:hypothetical protein
MHTAPWKGFDFDVSESKSVRICICISVYPSLAWEFIFPFQAMHYKDRNHFQIENLSDGSH